jgi:hypothetical protein
VKSVLDENQVRQMSHLRGIASHVRVADAIANRTSVKTISKLAALAHSREADDLYVEYFVPTDRRNMHLDLLN